MIFVVVAQSSPDKVHAAVQRVFPAQHLQLSNDQFLIAPGGTAKDISERLGVDERGALGFLAVFSVSGYWGWEGNAVWEWIAANWLMQG
jgi:hypothetical protein